MMIWFSVSANIGHDQFKGLSTGGIGLVFRAANGLSRMTLDA